MDRIHVSKLPKSIIALACATVLFGTATPLLKILVDGMAPLLLIALLAIGSGAGILCWRAVSGPRFTTGQPCAGRRESVPSGRNGRYRRICGARRAVLCPYRYSCCHGIASLKLRDCRDGSARVSGFSRTGRQKNRSCPHTYLPGSILLGWNGESALGFSLGALGIIISGFFWGVDNNCMAHISAYLPV